jgi:hypothetical protein
MNKLRCYWFVKPENVKVKYCEWNHNNNQDILLAFFAIVRPRLNVAPGL